jgi:hypothetical protein
MFRGVAGETVGIRKIETSGGAKNCTGQDDPAGSQQIVQTPPYQSPDNDPANYIAEDGESSIVRALSIGIRDNAEGLARTLRMVTGTFRHDASSDGLEPYNKYRVLEKAMTSQICQTSTVPTAALKNQVPSSQAGCPMANNATANPTTFTT